MSLEPLLRYLAAFDKRCFQLMSQKGVEPSQDELEAFERAIGFTLPSDFRSFALLPIGGLYVEAREEIWPVTTEFEVGPFWSFLRGLVVYGLSPKAPEGLQLEHAWRAMADEGSPHLVPFLKIIGSADPYCFTADGSIVIWRHDEPDTPEAVDRSFTDVLMKELADLESRVERKLRGG
jgi:hypothetical protein